MGRTGAGPLASGITAQQNPGSKQMGQNKAVRGPMDSEVNNLMAEEEREALAADWSDICVGLRKDLGQQLYGQWIRPIELGNFCRETGTLDLYLPTEFSANWVNDRFSDRLSLAWKIVRSEVRNVRISVHPGRRKLPELHVGPAAANDHTPAPTNPADAIAELGSAGLDPTLTFASFVTGEGNVLAYNAAQRMAASEAPQFSPLYLKAATGQGKTHLLHAMAAAFRAENPDASIIYMSAERFMTEFVNAIRSQTTMDFKARLRSAQMLLIDDVQFVAGKGPTQEELLHTLNELAERGARVAISADRAPQLLEGVDPRILSRLAGGLVADIQPAELDLRLAILNARRGQPGGEQVPAEVVDFLARAIRTNVRELEGAFNKLIAYAQLTGRRIDLEFAQNMLADAVRASARRITIDEIQKACAAHYRIEAGEMRSKRRARAVARPRQVAMYLAKKMTPRSLPEIGRIFGGRDHSTVIHAVRTIEALRLENPDLDADVRAIQRKLEG